MLSTGDFVVPRQQGHVFAERPPLTIWTIAAAGWLRGEVDPLAVRLPSVIAVVLTSLLIYAYSRALLSQSAAVAAALVYATFGQVLQIGRRGESEALFAPLVGAALLVWHLGYSRRWRPVIAWSIGFAFSALAALAKGPQAPVYFVAITTAYLLVVRRDWRYLLGWQFAIGVTLFVAIIAAWQVPFYRATNWPSVVAAWAGLAGDRIHLRGVFIHAVSYPVETLVCLLPWSPILAALISPKSRRLLLSGGSVAGFLLTALVVAYPTVWLASGARGRYFMPLYPLVAVLIGLLIDRCSTAALGTVARRSWNQFLQLWAAVIGCGAILLAISALLPASLTTELYQPRWFCFFVAGIGAAVVYVLWRGFRAERRSPAQRRCRHFRCGGPRGAGLLVNVNAGDWSDPRPIAENIKALLPTGAKLVSLTPIDHRFAYYYGQPIAELPWPRHVGDLPADVDYFCFMRYPGDKRDNAESGGAGVPGTARRARFRSRGKSLPPFASIASGILERVTIVVVGRVTRPLRAEITDATTPQHLAVKPSAALYCAVHRVPGQFIASLRRTFGSTELQRTIYRIEHHIHC